jgi:hypothetical protein
MASEYELGPATRMLWRDADAVQFEIGDRAMLVDGLSATTARALTAARETDTDPAASAALRHLAQLGLLWPRQEGTDDRRTPPLPRLAGELTSLAAGVGPEAAAVLAARRRACVAVQGSGRAGPHIGAVLAASGVGNVHFLAATDVRLHHAVPGGVTPADESQRLAKAARAAVLRAAPGTAVKPPPDTAPDLVVLAVDEPVEEDRRDALHQRGLAHLVVALGPAHAVVGPLVLPGLTSCLRCADLHRTDRDDAWPRLAVQLSVGRRYGPASAAAVATIAAGVAAMQALAFLDGAEPACLEGTLELHPPDWRLRRRSRPMHARCGCCLRAE